MKRYSLPTNKKDLGEALYSALRFSQVERNRQCVIWGATRYWLKGIRELAGVNWERGTFEPVYEIPGDTVVYEEALGSVQSEIGRLMKVDLRPVVSHRSMGLDSMRRAAIAHASLEYHNNNMDFDAARRAFATYLVHYGKAGIMSELMPARPKSDRIVEWRGKYNAIPPWELIGVPGESPTINMPTAQVRERFVPQSWVEMIADYPNVGLRPEIKLPPNDMDLAPKFLPFGAPVQGDFGGSMMNGVMVAEFEEAMRHQRGLNPQDRNKNTTKHIQFCEWFFSEDGVYLDAYVITSRNVVLGMRDYWDEGVEVWYPLGTAGYAETGGYYPKSFAEPRINLNRITEHLMEQVVRIVDDVDTLGHLFVHTGLGIRMDDFRRPSDGGAKVSMYAPIDEMNKSIPPFHQATPQYPNGLPGQVLQLITGLEERVMPQQSIFSSNAPRRAETEGSLQFIDQAANEPRSPASESMADAWTLMYRAQLDSQRRFYVNTGVIPITQFSQHIVGVIYDPKAGGIRLEKNAIPSPADVVTGVMSRSPKNMAAVEQALMQELQQGTMNPSEYRIQMRLKGIDRPMGAEEEWEAYQMAQLNIIMAFNDGETPGEVLDPMAGPVMIHLMALTTFMAGTRFALASKPVRKQFFDMLEAYRTKRGDFSDSASYPEDAAAQEEMMLKAQQQGGNGQMGLEELTKSLPGMMLPQMQ